VSMLIIVAVDFSFCALICCFWYNAGLIECVWRISSLLHFFGISLGELVLILL
jgi:hypothetical protein